MKTYLKSNNSAKLFFVKLLIFLLLGWGIDRACGMILSRISHNTGGNYRDYIINTAEGDCFVLGASTANHHYDPSVLADSLKMKVYNAGWDGEGIFHYYTLLNAICERIHPNLVILDLSPDALFYDAKYYDRLSYFNFWYDQDTTFRSVVHLKSKYEIFKMYSHLYRYNSNIDKVLFAFITGKQQDHDRFPYGYKPLACLKSPIVFDDYRPTNTSIDPFLVEYLERIIKKCKEENINLVVTMSPQYYLNRGEKSESHSLLLQICKEHHVPVIDNSRSAYFLDHSAYFIDNVHLCQEGAEVYTKLFLKELRDYKIQ